MNQAPPRGRPSAASALVAGAALWLVACTLVPPAFAHDEIAPTIARLRALATSRAPDSAESTPADRANALLDLGELERLEGEFEDAEAAYARAEALDPMSPRLALCRAALAANRADWPAADSLSALALARGAVGGETHRLRAHIHRAQGRTHEAIADLDRSLLEPDGWNPDAVVTRARWTLELFDRTAEHAFLVHALERDPKSIPIALKAIESELALGRLEAALLHLEDVLARCSGRCFELRARRADVLARLGRTLEADAERSAILDAIATAETARPRDLALAAVLREQLDERP